MDISLQMGLEDAEVFAMRWDPRGIRGEIDCGWIGEDANGIWTSRHPLIAFYEDPMLWDVWGQFQTGMHELTREDWETLSNWEVCAHTTMITAHRRELKRRQKEQNEQSQDHLRNNSRHQKS